MVLEGDTSDITVPGQFLNLQLDGFYLRRPISIHDWDDTSLTIIYKTVGEGTLHMTKLAPGARLDVLTGLGNGYDTAKSGAAPLLIGGGVGVPPLYELAKQYRRIDRKVDVVLGFNDAQSVFYADEFAALGCAVHVATMDGSAGVKGTVIDAIDAAGIQTDFVCSCGPVPMLKAVEARYSRGYMSFESRMACGIGACMACVAKDRKEADLYHRICKEGPVFPIGKVEF